VAWVSEDKDKEEVTRVNNEVTSCNDFRKMLWKDATHAVFGTKGNWVVAWVKYDTATPLDATVVYVARTADGNWVAPTTTNNDAPTVPVPDTPNKTNILKKCLSSKGGFNECTVNAELSEHNLHRLSRAKTPVLIHDEKASIKIQELLNDKTFYDTWRQTTPLPALNLKAGGDWTNCVESVSTTTTARTETDYQALPGVNTATNVWSQGGLAANLDVDTDDKKTATDNFLKVIWKKSKKVGFGSKD